MPSSKSSNALSGGCLTLFGLPFLAAGLVMTWLYFSGYAKWWDARFWVETPCWIESANLKTSRNKNRNTYKVEATYRYEFAGSSHQSDQVSFDWGSDNLGDHHQAAYREISRHQVKKPVRAESDGKQDGQKPFRCYVNPQKPSEAVLYRTLRWRMQAFLAIFALTFPAVGAALVFGGLLGMGKNVNHLREKHPHEPWKWKQAWVEPAIPDIAGAMGKGAASYAVWASLVIAPLILTSAVSGAFQSDPWAWLLLIFAAFWCLPAWLAIRSLRQYLAVGRTRFEMKNAPACPGGLMQGNILLERPLPMRGSAEVTVLCEKRVSRGSGKNRSVTTEKIWSHQEMIPHDRMSRDLTGFRLPVSFTLPVDAPESTPATESSLENVWTLVFKVPGTAIHSKFMIPVFKTGKSTAQLVSNAPSILDTTSGDLPTLLAEQRIHAEFDGAGGPVSVVCPPARHAMGILFLVIFNLIWTGVAVILFKQKAPLVFLIIWPFSACFIWLLIIWKLLYKRTVTCTRDGLTIVHRFGPVRREATIAKSQIVGFSHETNASSNNTSYYRVRLENTLGKKTTLADGINSSTTAEALSKRFDRWKASD